MIHFNRTGREVSIAPAQPGASFAVRIRLATGEAWPSEAGQPVTQAAPLTMTVEPGSGASVEYEYQPGRWAAGGAL